MRLNRLCGLVQAAIPRFGYKKWDEGACKIGINGAASLKGARWPQLKTISLCNILLTEIAIVCTVKGACTCQKRSGPLSQPST
jgi:hypothetical protein